MKTEKINLKSIKTTLSRAELKAIMAGSNPGNPSSNGGAGPYTILIYCHTNSGRSYDGTVLGTTCDKLGQLQQCMRVYPQTINTYSSCTTL